MNTSKYKKELKKLNSKQREAVETIEGTVLVIAGPGTGKTQVLTTRIAHILHETDTPPHGILALTFTDAGAHAMRRRLKDLIGNAAYSVEITTFHSFANSVIQDYPESFPKIIGFKQMDELEKLNILESIILNEDFELLKPLGDPLFYLKHVSGVIQDIKREGLGPEEFKMLLDKQVENFESIEDLRHSQGKREGDMKGKYKAIEKKIRKNFELQRLYSLYEQEKVTKKVFDYDDAILELLEALKLDSELLLILQERFLYILIDEHQDSNGAQNMIASYLSSFHENPNLFIVGDDKQAIYRFQGASLDNFLFFSKRYPKAKIIELTDNYRSHQRILDTAHELIQNNQTLSRLPLKQVSDRNLTKLEHLSFKTNNDESAYIAKSVKSLVTDKPESSVAILYRNNAEAFSLQLALEREGVSYSKISGTRSELHPYTEQFLTLLEICEEPTDPLLGKVLLYDCFRLPPEDAIVFLNNAQKEGVSLSQASVNYDSKAAEVIRKALGLHKLSANSSFFELFERVLHESDLIKSVIGSKKAQEILAEIQKLHTLARNLDKDVGSLNLKEFLAYIHRAKRLNLLRLQENQRIDSGVILSTVHGVKGLEFDSVYITGLENQRWGGKKKREYFYLPELQGLRVGESGEAEEDERRLLYVGITRARESLVMTSSQENEEGKDLTPSRFIDELGEEIETKFIATKFENVLHNKRRFPEHSLLDKGYVENLFVKRGLNATAVNKYLKCPWEYFFLSLLRLPQASSLSAQYGTAIHNALNRYLVDHTLGKKPTEEDLVSFFEDEIERSPMDQDSKRRLKAKGASDLTGYIKARPLLASVSYESERSVSNVIFELDSIRLRMSGKLDKIEYTESGLIVTDFKTGKPKSRNFLEGKTQVGSLDYKRQLTFYSELLYRSNEKMKEGVIDFVEPLESGLYRQERFSITEGEREELVKTIENMANEILSLEFINKGCKKKACEWCKLSESLFS